MSEDNGWETYKKLVVHELERSNDRLTGIEKRLGKIENRLTILQTKVYITAFVVSAVITGMIQTFLNAS
jgi:hypothetical protein